jgi:hypothetical protein
VTAVSAARAAARRLEDDEFGGAADSLRWVGGLERPGFGRDSNRLRRISVRIIAGGATSESSKSRKAQGSSERTGRGNAAGEQRTLGGDTPEVAASFGERDDFGRTAGRKESQSREGQGIRCTTQQWGGDGVHFVRRGRLRRVGACEECRCAAVTSFFGTKPGEPHSR